MDKLLHSSASSNTASPFAGSESIHGVLKPQLGSPLKLKTKSFVTESEKSKSVLIKVPGFEGIQQEVKRPQLIQGTSIPLSIEQLSRITSEVIKTHSSPTVPTNVYPTTSLTTFEQMYANESDVNSTVIPSCMVTSLSPHNPSVSSLPLATTLEDENAFKKYLKLVQNSVNETKGIKVYSISNSKVIPYTYHTAFYNPSFTSSSFTLILPLKLIYLLQLINRSRDINLLPRISKRWTG